MKSKADPRIGLIDEDTKAHGRDGASESTLFVATTFLRWPGSSELSR